MAACLVSAAYLLCVLPASTTVKSTLSRAAQPTVDHDQPASRLACKQAARFRSARTTTHKISLPLYLCLGCSAQVCVCAVRRRVFWFSWLCLSLGAECLEWPPLLVAGRPPSRTALQVVVVASCLCACEIVRVCAGEHKSGLCLRDGGSAYNLLRALTCISCCRSNNGPRKRGLKSGSLVARVELLH